MDQKQIRNFCIAAHVDHGKSTLADRFLELTGTVDKRVMKDQMLDQMDLERERGITIKLAPVTMSYNLPLNERAKWIPRTGDTFERGREATSEAKLQATTYQLNLIDTPGHVDFTYEVSRSLAAVEGALLLVDASQGIQAQTVGNLHLAREEGITIIPVLNKIDVQGADIQKQRAALARFLGVAESEVLLASGKTGQGVPELLQAVVERVPPPGGDPKAPLRALIFDSAYDDYQGVIAFVRIVDGHIRTNMPIEFLGTSAEAKTVEVGRFHPVRKPAQELAAGDIGYIVTGLKDINAVRVGDTITTPITQSLNHSITPLPGYKEMKPMVFVGFFPQEGVSIDKLRDAIKKLKLSDAALSYEPERSTALGFGFRLGLLGMLHLEIVRERIWREYDIGAVVTTPSVAYRVRLRDGSNLTIKSALDLPDSSVIDHIEEPYVRADIITPQQYIGGILKLAEEKRGIYVTTEYFEDRAAVRYELPLASIIVDFYDKLKSASSGYASFHYEVIDWRPADVVRLDILVAEEVVEAFSTMVYRDDAERVGRILLLSLKEAIPQQQLEIKLQARVGGKIIAAERIRALRKDVLAKLYGGDVTRKMKLLKKQKEGKSRRAAMGRGGVVIPPEAYLAVLKR